MLDRTWPKKAYKDEVFLNSRAARPVRVLCELLEPERRFEENNVHNTIVFFGSARTLPRDEAQDRVARFEQDAQPGENAQDAESGLERARADLAMARYYEEAAELAAKLTEWSLTLPEHQQFCISSGGGPGIMEAANRGALAAGGKTVALNISLPHEQEPNRYQTEELSFDFHYFFMRKLWFVNLARALVVFPGGFGTCDELFELLTLVQTRKLDGYRSIIIYGSEFWHELVNFEAFAKWGMISREDLKIFRFCDTVDEAFDFLKEEYNRNVIQKRNGDPRSAEARESAPQA
jgi:uncharacterized protein (TIGR00730 family)